MPKVDLIATKDFTYNTRRMKAGDDFQARNRDDAMILIEVLGKARMGRPKADVPPPPPKVAEKIEEEVVGTEAVEELVSKPVRTRKPKAGEKARKAKAKK